MTLEQLLDAWRVNNALNLEWLEYCKDEMLELKPGKGKTIRSNFVHLIGGRKMWSEEKLSKESKAIPKLDWKSATRREMKDGLNATSQLMAQLFIKMAESKRSDRLLNFFAYCIAHEAHHRSQIEISLRINGMEPEDGFLYGLWEWSQK